MLEHAISSVWAQHPARPAEVIVVDDGSEDETAAVAERLGAKVIRHGRNRGLAAARNTGVLAASYAWVALLDSDDEWLPHHLAHLWEIRDDHALVASSSLRYGTDPATDRIQGPPTRRPKVLRTADQLVHPGNFIPVSGCMIQRDLALTVGGFQARRGVVEDFDLWLRLLERKTGVCSPRVGILYRMHDEQMSVQDPRTMQLAHIEAADAHRERTNGSRVPVSRYAGVVAWDNMRAALRDGRRVAALRAASVLFSHPQRLLGAAILVRDRFVLRRRTWRVSRDGRPAVALVGCDARERDAVLASVAGLRFRDLSGLSIVRAMAAVVRQPPGLAVVGSRLQAALVRAAGVQPLSAERAIDRLSTDPGLRVEKR